ncbi:MAG: hypothetical protein IJL05_02075 [Alphaproteobacteria bacterium]|nr:hypothetical protein [Alphaproteobacteria bacterium]
MKKITILTSVLVLAACGGGSGGNGGSGAAPAVNPVVGRSAVTADVVSSNEKITSMASEILVAGDGSKITPSISRHASLSYGGQTYESYRLDDVDFKMGGEDSLVKFELNDKGQIVALTKMDRADDFTGDPVYDASQEGTFTRTGDTAFTKNLYVYGYELDNTGISDIISTQVDSQITADVGDLSIENIREKIKARINKDLNKLKASQPDNSMDTEIETARTNYLEQVDNMDIGDFNIIAETHATLNVEGINNGLRFADLGFAELVVKDETDANIIESNYSPYVGGYEVLKVNPSELGDTTVYEGVAIAGLDHKKKGYGSGIDVKEGVLLKQNNARLTVNTDNSSSLRMDNLVVDRVVATTSDSLVGEKWYDVQIDVAANGDKTFKISGTNNVTGYNLPNIADVPVAGVTFSDTNWKAHEQQYVQNYGDGDDGYRFSGTMETNVYGRNADDTEATARFSFGNEKHSDSNTKHDEVAIYGAFGGGVAQAMP